MDPNNGQGGNPAPGAGGANLTPWHGNDFAQLVTAKGWKGPDDALKSYSELETFVGAPADRVLKLPEANKIDDAFRQDVFKRIGYTPPTIPGAPEKAEDYGLQVRAGVPPEYGSAITQAAHKLGITKEQLAGLVQANDAFIDQHSKAAKDAEDKLVGDRITAADSGLKPEERELLTRAAADAGYDADSLKVTEEQLALVDDKALGLFRKTLLDNARLRIEAPLHRGSTERMGILTPEQAKGKLAELSKNPDWAAKALQRGTAEAEENLRLNRMIAGSKVDENEIQREAKGNRG
jgi:hypothetical protein